MFSFQHPVNNFEKYLEYTRSVEIINKKKDN